ncbi:MAG: hypothetical protein DWQ07_19350 [Chloroflexi bacterium]|nr:MAG: hypothetical protein DWQ07_19350 [Chloroflexota bacterium]MBL1194239.1 hypothetical protein [Chloroflexota bacterium]NOH11532.1 hypothetical protein [Chloroflexota bacterium]
MGRPQHYLGFVLLMVGVLFTPFAEPARAQSSIELPISNLQIELNDVVGVTTYYRDKCHWGDCGPFIKYDFMHKEGEFAEGSIVFEPGALKPILESLHSLYPGNREIGMGRIHDYSAFWIQFELDDNTHVNLSTQSHFPHLIPWVITVWKVEDAENPQLTASYYLFHDELHQAVNDFLAEIGSETLPYESALDYGSGQEETADWLADYESITFHKGVSSGIYGAWNLSGDYYGNSHKIHGSPKSIISPFFEIIDTNPVFHQLFEMGFSIHDLSFAVSIDLSDFKPIQYAGEISLLAPSGHDAVISDVTIDLGDSGQVTTSLDIEEVLSLVEERQTLPFLEDALSMFPEIVFLLQTDPERRPFIPYCPGSSDLKPDNISYRVDTTLGYLKPYGPNFFFLEDQSAWTVEFSIPPYSDEWDNLWEKVLDSWLPDSFSVFDASDVDYVFTYKDFAFVLKPDVQENDPKLIAGIKNNLPQNFIYHDEHSQKAGDYFRASAESRLIIPENGDEPYFVECKEARDSIDVTEIVTLPDANAPRKDIGHRVLSGWIMDQDFLGDIGFYDLTAQPDGTVHLLWEKGLGVFYAEGHYDGSGWTRPQLMSNAFFPGREVHAMSNTAGDVHLLWDFSPPGSSGEYSRNTVHLWKSTEGNWQVSEIWDYTEFDQIFVDDSNTIHMAWEEYDGIDNEYFYAYWNETEGLSTKENISRRLGNPLLYSFESLKIAIDQEGTVHAAWVDILEEETVWNVFSKSYVDSYGIYYATREKSGGWTPPEFVGTNPNFLSNIAFGLAEGETPIVIWQADSGITSRTKLDGTWQEPAVLMEIDQTYDIDPRSYSNWDVLRARIRTSTDELGTIHLIWSRDGLGVHYSSYANNEWAKPLSISEEEKPFLTLLDAHAAGRAHIVFLQTTEVGRYEHERDGQLVYVEVVDNQVINFHNLPVFYDSWTSIKKLVLEVDSADRVYLVGIPSLTKIMIRVD